MMTSRLLKPDTSATHEERFDVIFDNPFLPHLVVDNDGDDTPRATRHAGIFSNKYAPRRFDPFGSVHYHDAQETRTEAAAKALDAAERDLAAARQRTADADRKNERRARLEREATLTERSRILTILKSSVAARHPGLAKRVALESDSPADEAIAAMEEYERESAANSAKAMSDKIVHAGNVRRGLADAPVIVGPKVFVKTTAEEIIEAGKKARSPS
jgi:hypothetical protein